MAPHPDHHAALAEHFGFPAFRPGQEAAVTAALADRDVLVVMPTGAGKSLCYQLPALMREDLTLVVSPLVALMEDQVAALGARAPGRVALVTAQRDPAENEEAIAAAVRGDVRVLYVAPERFSSPGFTRAIGQARVGLFVVDEAHCVSQWGHDFRPDYFRLADAARWLGARAIVASTATATPQVAADVVARLGLRDPVRIATGFDRPNLSFGVLPSPGDAAKERQLVAALSEPGATPAIVYAGTRRAVDRLAERLGAALEARVVGYHAGLDREARARAQHAFMSGEADVVVATNAFGMGVDKADVRTVLHASVPSSLEAYYQEAGRAGRDGAPARALLLAAGRDKGLHVHFIERAAITPALIQRVALRLEAAVGGPPAVDPAVPRPVFDIALVDLGDDGDQDRVRAVVGTLVRAGVLQPAPSPPDRARGRLLTGFDGRARAVCKAIAGDAQAARWRQYRAIWGYVDGERCRRAAILGHFGDAAPGAPTVPCCDVCSAEAIPEAVGGAAAARPTGLAAVGDSGDLDAAILATVAEAEPALGRTRTVEVLRGARNQVVQRHAYDGLPAYGTFGHLAAQDVLAAVDALIASGRLVSTGGMYPKLRVPDDQLLVA